MKLKKIKKYIKYLSRLLKKDSRFVSEQEYKYQNKLKYLHSNNLLKESEESEEQQIDITQLMNNSNMYKNKYNNLLKTHNNHLINEMNSLNTIESLDKEKAELISKFLLELSKLKVKT
jgi:broad-specificity NMP kinase